MVDSALWRALCVPPSDGPAVVARLRASFCAPGAAPDAPLIVEIISSGLPETISISNAEMLAVYTPLLLWLKARAAACTRQRCIVGVAGPAGSGKTTLASLADVLLNTLSENGGDFPRTAKIEMDGYHLPNAELDELGLRKRKGVIETICGTALAGDLARLELGARADLAPGDDAAHVGPLRTRAHWSAFDSADGSLLFPDYDRLGTHDPRLRARCVAPDVRLVIVEGLFIARGDGGGELPVGPDAGAWARVRACMDEVILIRAPLSLCRARCIARRARSLAAPPDQTLASTAPLDAVVDHYRRNDAPTWADINADAPRATVRLTIPLPPAFARAEADAGGDALDVPWRVALEALRATAANDAFDGLTID